MKNNLNFNYKMSSDDHFDDDDSVGDEEEVEIELDDEDVDVDDYAGQDRDVNSIDVVKIRDDNENLEEKEDFSLEDPIAFEESLKFSNYSKRKTKSNIEKISRYEFSKLVGRLAQYITESKIDVLDEMLELPVVKTGNAINIARFWVENRKIYKLPLTLKRQLTLSIIEELDPSNLKLDDDYHFTDENDNTSDRFYQNFREKSYGNDA